MTFKATASADEQNEVAKLIRDQGINVQYSNAAKTGDDTKVINSVTVSLNGTDKYTVTGAGNNYSIKDAKGNEVATFTLNNDQLGEQAQADAITGTETFTASKATAGYKNGAYCKVLRQGWKWYS